MFDKKKVSIDFLQPLYQRLNDTAKEQGVSNSKIVNMLVDLFLQLSPDVACDIGTYCHQKYQSERIAAAALTGFAQQDKLLAADQYQRLSEYFGYNVAPTDQKMRRIYLKEGYALVPDDWIVLNDVIAPADQCMYAGIVESRNCEKYQIPHFVFFSDYKYSADYPADLEEKVYTQCAAIYPDFRRLYNMQRPIPDESRTDPEGLKLISEWMEAPGFGLFHLVEKGDPHYWNKYRPDYDPPYGAMIVRDDK